MRKKSIVAARLAEKINETTMDATAKKAIEVKRLSKAFGRSGQRLNAIFDTSFTINEGEFVSIIGPSGCGKSTLLHILSNLSEPSSGTIKINGKTPRAARKDRDHSYVFQAPVLFEWRTVKENVILPLEIGNGSTRNKGEHINELLQLVKLDGFGNYYPHQLSGGMQQRVSIARALSLEPSIMFMDEPFGALDEMTREDLNQELLSIWENNNLTVLFVTHGIPEAVFLSSRVLVMGSHPGRIVADIPIDLPYPRNNLTRESKHFYKLLHELREILSGTQGNNGQHKSGGYRRQVR